MSDSEDDYWRSNSSNSSNDDEKDLKSKDNDKNGSLHYQYFDELHVLIDAANGDEDLCIEAIQKLSRKIPIIKYANLNELTRAIQQYCKDVARKSDGPITTTTSSTSSSASSSLPLKSYLEKESADDMILLNLLYAPRRSRLHSIMKVLVRIENMSHICAWTQAAKVILYIISSYSSCRCSSCRCSSCCSSDRGDITDYIVV